MKKNILITALLFSLVSIKMNAASLVEGAVDTAERAVDTGLNAAEGGGRIATGRPYEDEYGNRRYWGDRPGIFNRESFRRYDGDYDEDYGNRRYYDVQD
jgi:hypothetical protein